MRTTMTFELLNPWEHQELSSTSAESELSYQYISMECVIFPFVAHGSQPIMQLRWIVFIEFDTMYS